VRPRTSPGRQTQPGGRVTRGRPVDEAVSRGLWQASPGYNVCGAAYVVTLLRSGALRAITFYYVLCHGKTISSAMTKDRSYLSVPRDAPSDMSLLRFGLRVHESSWCVSPEPTAHNTAVYNCAVHPSD
jgi:hypothetical protein